MVAYAETFDQAERLRTEGKVPEALEAYSGLLRQFVDRQAGDFPMPFTINEFYILDRFADLTLLIGNKPAAEYALSGLLAQAKAADHRTIRIHAANKRFFVHLDQGSLQDAIGDVRQLADLIGDVETMEFSPAGLMTWEKGIRFDAAARPQDRKDQLVCLYDMLSALLVAMGRYTDGILLLRQGIAHAEKNPSPIVDARLPPMRLLLVKAHFENGDTRSANDELKAMAATAPGMPIASGIPVYYRELRSRLALAQGRLGEAYAVLNELIQLCRQNRLPLAVIKSTFNLAKLKILLNQVADATDLLKECLADAEKAGETALAARITGYLSLADQKSGARLPVITYPGRRPQPTVPPRKPQPVPAAQPATRQNPAPAAPRTPQAAPPPPAAKPPAPADFFAAYEERSLLFQLYLSADQRGKAAELLSQLRLTARTCDSTYIEQHLAMLGLLYLAAIQAPIPANYPYKPILDCFTTAQLLPTLWQLRQLLVHTPLVAEEARTAWIIENQRLLEQITESLPPIMQTLFLLNKWSPNEEYLAALSTGVLQQKHDTQTQSFGWRRWRGQWQLMGAIHSFQENANRYKDYLARTVGKGETPGSFDFSQQEQKGLWGKLWRQPYHRLTISYLVLPDRIIIVSRSFLRMRVHVTYISRVVLRQLVFDLRDRLYPKGATRGIMLASRPSVDPSVTIETLAQQLGDILQLDTILRAHGQRDPGQGAHGQHDPGQRDTGQRAHKPRARRQKIRRLTFVPDDVLHGFPFTLLTAGGEPIAKKITVAISVDDQVTKQPPVKFRGKTALLAGVARGVPGLDDLPAVTEEIRRLDAVLKNYGATVELLENQAATPATIKQLLRVADTVHLSCHGKFDYRQPDQSGLLLAGGEMLTLKDILALGTLSKVQLAVLSSCRGAEHFILPGRWIIGLPETLCRAGIATVLAFLWPVDDDFAMAFTTRYYRHLQKNTPAASLRLTLDDAVNKRFDGIKVEYWQPQFWAGAILYQR
jgi:tetratricopeptide (TPR) repeat protein